MTTAQEIESRLQKIWPDLQQIWIFDQSLTTPKKGDMESFLEGHWINVNTIKSENPDCDDYALMQHAIIKQFHNWAFGEAFCDKVGGWSILHNLNICCCEEGVFLIDPKKRLVVEASPINDNILWVRM